MPDQVTVKKHNDANKLGYFISVTRKGAYSVPWAPMIVGKRVSIYPGGGKMVYTHRSHMHFSMADAVWLGSHSPAPSLDVLQR